MTWNISAESISLVMIGIIWVYARKGSHLPTLKNKVFQGCLVVTFSAILTNILSTLMISQYQLFPMWLTWSVTTVYYILTPLMGMAYFLYSVSVIYTDSAQLKKMIGLGTIPGVIYAILVLVNPFIKILFDINPAYGYVRGPQVFVTYLIFYAYCLASIGIVFANYKKIDRNIYRILAAFPILAVLVIMVQEIYPDVILSGSAATCALLIIYLHLQNKQISLDYLTGVPNRQELLNMLKLMIRKSPSKEFALLVVSMRDFRQINNSCGQQMGDEFLKKICHFLCDIGPKGNVYRFGGDEFALLFPQKNEEQIKLCISAIEERMRKSWQVGNLSFMLSAAIGVINHLGEDETLEKIINAIEYAIYQAKSGKHGEVCYCDKVMMGKLERRNTIIQILKQQVEEQSFEMFYQPIYCVESDKFAHAESLMRMPHTPIGPIYPNEFIPIAEEAGLIVDITYIVLDKVCNCINRLVKRGVEIDSIHVNFSAIQFAQPDLSSKVLEIIRRNGTPMSAIKIEFTESTLAESTEAVTKFAMEMMDHGIKMGLDDFGTGYSNIASVINIPFGTVKLDKSLVWVAVDNEKPALAVKHLTQTFKELGMTVIAEGVENEEQRKLVVDFGVDQIQGFYYAKPMSEEGMEHFLQKKSSDKG